MLGNIESVWRYIDFFKGSVATARNFLEMSFFVSYFLIIGLVKYWRMFKEIFYESLAFTL